MVRLGDVCDILNGYAFKSEEYSDSGFRIIRISNVQKGYVEDTTPVFYPEDNPIVNKYELFENDLLLSLTGNVGRVALLEKEFLPAALNQRVACLRPKKGTAVRTKYLFHILNSDAFEKACILSSKGLAQKNMSTEWLKDYLIPLPSLEKQDEISETLNKVDELISLRKKQLQKLDDLIKSRFVEMFGDPITNTKRLDTKCLKDILILKAGDFTAASEISDRPTETNKYPCYGGNGIRGYVTDFNQEGDYSLIGRQGALSGNVQFASGRFKNTEHALLVTPVVTMNSIWLNQLLLILDLKRYQTGAAQPGLSVKNLQEIQIITVSIDEQDRFARFVEQTEKTKAIIQKGYDKLEQMKQALMQKYFG